MLKELFTLGVKERSHGGKNVAIPSKFMKVTKKPKKQQNMENGLGYFRRCFCRLSSIFAACEHL